MRHDTFEVIGLLKGYIVMNNRFLIGQFEKFDELKHAREHRDGFKGIEVCQFASISDIDRLVQFTKANGLDFGVHFPLRKGRWKYRDPQHLSNNPVVHLELYKFMEDEFDFISSTGAEYVLLHYLKPVILDKAVDWDRCWRFADSTEFYFEDEYPYGEFKKQSEEFFSWINKASDTYGIDVYLELDAVNAYLYNTNLLSELLEEYKNIRLCLDIGRLHLQNMIDDEFDAFEFIAKIGRYVEHVHLWNVRVTNNLEGSHHAMLPRLKVEDGWADTEAYFRVLNKYCGDYTLLFEHNTGNITDKELQECYDWINRLVVQGSQA